jgi:hypothetical protein
MRRHKTIVAFAACALILVMMGMMSFNCIEKLSQGCPFSQKMQVKANPCLRDSVTSPSTTGVVALPASAPVVPEPMLALNAEGINSSPAAINSFVETPPLRC